MEANLVDEKMSIDWAKAYTTNKETGCGLAYPSETLVRLFRGDYVTGEQIDVAGKSVLDIGFGGGNNIFLRHMACTSLMSISFPPMGDRFEYMPNTIKIEIFIPQIV